MLFLAILWHKERERYCRCFRRNLLLYASVAERKSCLESGVLYCVWFCCDMTSESCNCGARRDGLCWILLFYYTVSLRYGSESSWIQIQRSRVRFPALPHFLRTSWSATGSTKTNSVAFSAQANYTHWATATCWRNLVPAFADRGVSRGQRGGSHTVVNLSFLDRTIGQLNRIIEELLEWKSSGFCLENWDQRPYWSLTLITQHSVTGKSWH
jgi:hypothetical protein